MPRTNLQGVKFPQSQRMRWARNVKALRGSIPQTRFAGLLGIPPGTLWKIEHGEMNITDDMKWLICGKVGQSVDDIFPAPAIVPVLTLDIEDVA